MSEPQHRDFLSRRRGWHPSDPESEPFGQPVPSVQNGETDLDRWVEMASGDPSPVLTGPLDPEALAGLRDDLLRALDADHASLVPPSAGMMSQEDWDALGAGQRWVYQRTQLRRLDPRLISRTISRLSPGRRLGAR